MKFNKLRKCKKDKYNYYVINILKTKEYNNIKIARTLIFDNEKEAKLSFDEIARKYFYNKKEKYFTTIENKENIDIENIENAFDDVITMITTTKQNEKIPYKYEIISEKEENKLIITLIKLQKTNNKFYKKIKNKYKDNKSIVYWHSGGDISVKNK